jgi:hypothetical protein
VLWTFVEEFEDLMRSLLTNTPLIIALGVIAIIVSTIISCRFSDWTWFSRFGGIITLLGGVLATRRIIRLGVDEIFEDDHTIDGGGVVPTPEDIESSEQARRDIVAAKLAFWFVSLGTLIWAFGDLLSGVIQ